MEKQTNEIPEMDWINKELTEQQNNKPTDRKPAIKLEENKIYEFEIDFSKQWDKWVNPEDGSVKKLLPVKYSGVDSIFFLSVKNPLYKELLEKGSKGQRKFKVMRTGQAKNTRYHLVE